MPRLAVLLPLVLSVNVQPVSAGPLPAPLTEQDFPPQSEAQARLGQLLFYDKILSGNKNISCGTCHHHTHFGSDGLSLGIGEGGQGVGPDRQPGTADNRIRKRIPRNAPALWNLGAKEIKRLFHDGRLSLPGDSPADDYDTGFNSPAEERLPQGLSGLLAAQALFPLAARFEMAGDPQENSVARAAFDRIDHVWPIITRRIQAIPEYVALFSEAFEHIATAADIDIVDIANALAAFETVEWQSFDSPFDEYLQGNKNALSATQRRGLNLFYGEAGCDRCHHGSLLSDQQFHALSLPAFGPGRTRLYDPIPRDTGRLGESDRLEDSYRFRTPSLRNVEHTGPYGHNGAYKSLSRMIEHHFNPHGLRDQWQRADAVIPVIAWLDKQDMIVQLDQREMARYRSKLDIEPQTRSGEDINALTSFLHSLSGRTVRDTPFGIPDSVPSGIPVDK